MSLNLKTFSWKKKPRPILRVFTTFISLNNSENEKSIKIRCLPWSKWASIESIMACLLLVGPLLLAIAITTLSFVLSSDRISSEMNSLFAIFTILFEPASPLPKFSKWDFTKSCGALLDAKNALLGENINSWYFSNLSGFNESTWSSVIVSEFPSPFLNAALCKRSTVTATGSWLKRKLSNFAWYFVGPNSHLANLGLERALVRKGKTSLKYCCSHDNL